MPQIISRDVVLAKISEKVLIIDVRGAEDFGNGCIPSALNLPLPVIEQGDEATLTKELPTLKKESEVILYCQSGRRAGKAASLLEGLGFKNVSVYQGSWAEWSSIPL